MLNRRKVLQISAAAGVIGIVAPQAIPEPVPQPRHPLFATTLFEVVPESMLWHRQPMWATSADAEAIKSAWEQGLDLVAELKAVAKQGTFTEIEQTFLKKIRDQRPKAVFDQTMYDGSFVGDLHAKFIDLIMAANPVANTVIVGPTAFTIIQSSTSSRFRREAGWPYRSAFPGCLRIVGTIDEHVTVLCDPYASDRIPVVVGHVSETEAKRKMAVVEIDGEYAVGATPDFAKDWVTLGLDVSTLSFI